MKLFDKNKVLFTLLTVGVTFNILWSMQLETRADKLGTIVEQYHDRLMKLEDSFPFDLEKFSRTVKGLEGPNKIEIAHGAARLVAEDIELKTNAEGDNRIHLSSVPEVGFWCNAGSSSLNLNPGLKYAQLKYNNPLTSRLSSATLGEEGIQLRADDMFTAATGKGNRLSLTSDPEVGLWCNVGPGVLNLKSQRIDLYYDEFGKGHSSVALDAESVELGQSDTGALVIGKGKGFGISAKNSNPVQMHGENDLRVDFDGNIEINAKGNINIRSENGQIKINGQEIHLNEASK